MIKLGNIEDGFEWIVKNEESELENITCFVSVEDGENCSSGVCNFLYMVRNRHETPPNEEKRMYGIEGWGDCVLNLPIKPKH